MANGMIMGDYQIISSGNHVLQQPNILFQSYDFVQAIALTHHDF